MTLLVKPSKGYLTHNTNFFTSMDPYCYVYLGKQAQKTSPHYGGGIKPSWNEVLKFKVENITKLGVQIWAKALIGNDALIGQGLLNIRKINLANGGIVQEYVDVFIDNKPAGRILLQIKFIPAQTPQHHPSPQHIPQPKANEQKWSADRKPQRHSWAGDVNWRGSNATDNQLFQPSQSAVYSKQEMKQDDYLVSPKYDNPFGFSEAVMNANFNKKKESQRAKTEQEAANQYLNQQMLKNFAPKISNVDANGYPGPKIPQNPHNYQQHQNYQQQLYQQQLQLQQQQQKQLQLQLQQNQNKMFQNTNNGKPSTGLTPGTVIAQPNKNYNPSPDKNHNPHPNTHRVGLGSTPPKSILNPPTEKSKSLGKKKVKFDDRQ